MSSFGSCSLNAQHRGCLKSTLLSICILINRGECHSVYACFGCRINCACECVHIKHRTSKRLQADVMWWWWILIILLRQVSVNSCAFPLFCKRPVCTLLPFLSRPLQHISLYLMHCSHASFPLHKKRPSPPPPPQKRTNIRRHRHTEQQTDRQAERHTDRRLTIT